MTPQTCDETALSAIGFDTLTAARKAGKSHRMSLIKVLWEVEIPAVLRRGRCWTVAIFPDHRCEVVCHVAGSDGKWYEACRVRGSGRYDRLHMCRGENDTLVPVSAIYA